MICQVCKLYKSVLFIASYFEHAKCFIWDFLVLAFIETARINTTSSRNFSWSGNDIILVWKLYIQSLQIKTLFFYMSGFLHRNYILFGRHVHKNCKVKEVIYSMINFYFKLSGTFPIVKNNSLQHYVNGFNKKNYQIITNHLSYNKKT